MCAERKARKRGAARARVRAARRAHVYARRGAARARVRAQRAQRALQLALALTLRGREAAEQRLGPCPLS